MRAGAAGAIFAVALVALGLGTAAGLPILDPPDGSPGDGPSGDAPPADGFPDVGEPLFIDPGVDPNPARLWGPLGCQRPRRARVMATGGDSHVGGDRVAREDRAFRRLRLKEGDDFSGERCELGYNDRSVGPTALFSEGSRLITFLSLRLPKSFPARRDDWKVVMQMKQTQPSDAGGGPPMLALEVVDGRWLVRERGVPVSRIDDGVVWTAPAKKGEWVRFAFNVLYSADPERGSLRVFADLDGDGDALGRHERTPTLTLQTLKRESAGTDDDGLSEGEPIPSHLRVGLYHDEAFECRRYACSIDVDNVGIYAP